MLVATCIERSRGTVVKCSDVSRSQTCQALHGRLFSHAMTNVTRLLNAIDQGDPHAAGELLPLVYEELPVALPPGQLANEKPGQTLQATALVHEAFLRLVGDGAESTWDNRGHFFAAAAEAMRRILVEKARFKRRNKHGGKRRRVELVEEPLAFLPDADAILDQDDALTRLAAEDPRCDGRGQVAFVRRPASRTGGHGAWHLPRHGLSQLGLRSCLATVRSLRRQCGSRAMIFRIS